MTNTYDSRYGDRLCVPSVGEIRCFHVTPKYPSSARFDVFIIADTELKDALTQFFNAQLQKAAKDRCCMTVSHHLDETTLELTVINHHVEACAEGRRYKLIATMENQDLRTKASSVIQSKRV